MIEGIQKRNHKRENGKGLKKKIKQKKNIQRKVKR